MNRVAARVGLRLQSTEQAQSDRDHQAAFRKAGLGTVRDRPASLAAVIRASAVPGALVAALDDWAVCSTDCCKHPTSIQP
jgi:hypothetical protein